MFPVCLSEKLQFEQLKLADEDANVGNDIATSPTYSLKLKV